MNDKYIPKVIHYCWFGGKPFDELTKKCIKSWKKYCPDYELILWNENNFDFSSCEYAVEAYKQKKWAFVSDYARYKVLYEYGGVYLDTDVELIKNIDDLVKNGPYFGIETERITVAPGLGMAAYKKMDFYKIILDYYESSTFKIDSNATNNYITIVDITTNILFKYGLENKNEYQNIKDISIYPKEYLNPYDFDKCEINITENTVSIHHYAASWTSKTNKINTYIFKKIKRFKNKLAQLYERNKV